MNADQQQLALKPDESTAPAAEPIYVHLAITDPEVLAAVGEYPNGPLRMEFVSNCIKVGVLSLRAAKGVVDGGEIRAAGDHLIASISERLTGYRTLLEENLANSLSHYFDPANGLFSNRVENLVKDDGELVRVINGQISTVQQGLAATMERFVGENSAFLSLLDPSESNRLLAAMRQTVSGVMDAEKAVILGQFSLDNPDSALARLVRELTTSHGNLTTALGSQLNDVMKEFSLDKSDSALSRLVGRVEAAQNSISREFSLDNEGSALRRLRDEVHIQLNTLAQAQSSFHSEVVGLLSAMNARKEAEAKSTTHGAVFEEAVGSMLRMLGVPAGDIVEDCGTTTGLIRNSKVGDHVVTLPPESAAAGARIVVEAKESSSYNLRSTLEEADEARRNRGAGICLFVHSSRTAPAGLEPMAKYGSDVVVVWNPEDPNTDVVFKAGYLTAKALSIRAAQRSGEEAASFQKIDKAIEAVRKQLEGFDSLKTAGETIQNSAVKVIDRVRIMRTDLERQMEILSDQIGSLKDAVDVEGCA
jgi:hypothetical protein